MRPELNGKGHLTKMEEEKNSVPKMHQHILALSFAVDEINGNPQILPNLTLGFHIINGYYIAKMRIGTWIVEVVNASLREGRVPAPLKEAIVRPVLKKASLDPEMATNYRPVANIPFLGKVLERVVTGQLQALLDETDYLDPFQSGFRPGYGTECASVALYDDLCREKDRGSASLLVLLDLSVAFDTIDHGEAVAVLNRCLVEVMGWMRANRQAQSRQDGGPVGWRIGLRGTSMPKMHQHILALSFAVDEINGNPQILPNLTLGFHIINGYYIAKMRYKATMRLLCTYHRFVPNFSSATQKKIAAVIGGLVTEASEIMAIILAMYKIPQLTYGSFSPAHGDKTEFPFLYQMVPKESHQYLGVVRLLQHFGWTWIGLLAVDDDYGDKFLQTVVPLLSQNDICYAFIFHFPERSYLDEYAVRLLKVLKNYPVLMEGK
ncbi:hypothetical protein EYD10_18093, partial [Varanus komodoensis]